MRFPTALAEDRMAAFRAAKAKAKRPEDVPSFPVGPPHAWTLMDGEMVVDAVDPPPGSGAPKAQRRRCACGFARAPCAGRGSGGIFLGDNI
jgi:hypothetical protein